jgi:DNA-binding transcriptional MerR regulator
MSTPTNPAAEAGVPELLTCREMAKAARCCTRTLVLWRKRKIGPPFVRVGTRVFYQASDARAWLLRNRTEA